MLPHILIAQQPQLLEAFKVPLTSTDGHQPQTADGGICARSSTIADAEGPRGWRVTMKAGLDGRGLRHCRSFGCRDGRAREDVAGHDDRVA